MGPDYARFLAFSFFYCPARRRTTRVFLSLAFSTARLTRFSNFLLLLWQNQSALRLYLLTRLSNRYIPLCIYFNLLNQCVIASENIIYIPLCIYLNLRRWQLWRFKYGIYIPLCIYFNINLVPLDSLEYDIYIPLCIYFNSYNLHDQSLYWHNLHSTMYLFKRCRHGTGQSR